MRTAALSAAVTRWLAPPEPKILALVGSGVQAAAHLEALRTLYDFTEVRVASRTPANAAAFAAKHGAIATDIETAVRGADIIVTATSSKDPVVLGAWLKPGAHVNAVGSSRPAWRELDDAAMANLVVVDSREAALKEAGDIVQSGATIFAEAGEIFAGTKVADRTATTIFKSVGLAVEDIAAARIVYDAISQPAADHSAIGSSSPVVARGRLRQSRTGSPSPRPNFQIGLNNKNQIAITPLITSAAR